jgi:hypothetical protein
MAASSSTDDASISDSSIERVDVPEQEQFKGDSIMKGQSKGSAIGVSHEKDADTCSTYSTSILNSASEETEENSSASSQKLKKSVKFSEKMTTKLTSEDSPQEHLR